MLYGKWLWEFLKDKYDLLWVKGGGYCNLEIYFEYIKYFCKFINVMEKFVFKNLLIKELDDELRNNEIKYNCCLSFKKK